MKNSKTLNSKFEAQNSNFKFRSSNFKVQIRVHGGSMSYIGRTSSLHFLTGTELHRNGKVHGGSMNHFFILFLFFHYVFIKIFPQQPLGLGFQSLNTGCGPLKRPNFGRVHGGSMNYIGRTLSLHFLTRTELHRNGKVHGGGMNHFFIFVFIFSLCFY